VIKLIPSSASCYANAWISAHAITSASMDTAITNPAELVQESLNLAVWVEMTGLGLTFMLRPESSRIQRDFPRFNP